jgi:hypothetical protein
MSTQATTGQAPASPPEPYSPTASTGLPWWSWILILGWIALCLWPVLRRPD